MCSPSPPKPPKSPPPPPQMIDPTMLAARDKQRRALINAQGFRSTILTSPLGLGTFAPTTLLGSAARRG